MDLLLLAPDIQEELLFLPAVAEARDPLDERRLRNVVVERDGLAAAEEVVEIVVGAVSAVICDRFRELFVLVSKHPILNGFLNFRRLEGQS